MQSICGGCALRENYQVCLGIHPGRSLFHHAPGTRGAVSTDSRGTPTRVCRPRGGSRGITTYCTTRAASKRDKRRRGALELERYSRLTRGRSAPHEAHMLSWSARGAIVRYIHTTPGMQYRQRNGRVCPGAGRCGWQRSHFIAAGSGGSLHHAEHNGDSSQP